MPTTSTSDDPDRKATSSPLSAHTSTPLNYAVTHVFLPVELPERTDYTLENEHSLARAVCAAAHAYGTHVCGTSEQAQWHLITKMLDNLQASVQSEHMDNDHVISQLRGMQTGDILAFFVRRQNAAIILTKRENCMLCEAFEVSPSGDAVMETLEPLACSYPGSAVETPSEVFDNGDFQFELANFISRPNAADSDLPLPPPTDPQYINALFNGVLQNVDRATDEVPRVTKHTALLTGPLDGVGRPADASRIMKRVRDHVGLWFRTSSRPEDTSSWHRSLLWLLIRVAIQTSVNRSPARASYKRFVLFFICTFARDESNTTLSSDLLHLMLSKILRRLSKLGSSTPDWLSEVAVGTCTCLRGVLDARWEQLNARPSPFRNPSQDELTRDTQLSLLHSGEYIRNALANPGPQLDTPFHPSHRRRGTIEEFLSSNGTFFDEAYAADPNVTLYDVEKLVEEGIDDWFACVTNVDEACVQLEILMDKYMTKICELKSRNPEDMSTRLLTAIELYVALDKLVVKEIPMLADYSPEIPIACLGTLLLRKKTSLHRLSCAYQYLSARHSQSRLGWSVLSNEFTKDSFPVRYYDQSPRFQLLKARIEEDAVKKIAGQASPQLDGASLLCSPGECQEYQISRRRLAESEEVSHSPLPALLLHAKVVVFELQCPACVHSWRSAAPRILHHFWNHISIRAQPIDAEEQNHLLARVPALQAYLVERREPPLRHQIHFAYFYPEASQSRNHPMLRYVFRYPRYSLLDSFFRSTTTRDSLSIWQSWRHQFDEQLSFKHRPCLPHWHRLKKYVNCTFHTPNDVMSAQADCPADLSLDEFIAFAHLRSGGSLQWLNILQGLRSRTLNLRRHQVHSLLTYAALEVGPLDLNAGTWIWHQELQDSFFCNALLDELDSLIMGVRAQSIDGVQMSTVSLLLTRVLASSPNEGVSDRCIALLRSVRRKTFSWVQELSYDLAHAPTNEERRNLLLDMAVTCRSTFDVDPATLHKVFYSAEDVDALLSCIFFIHALRPDLERVCYYSRLLLERDSRLSPALEEILKDVILADVSDYGVDLAVGKIFAWYKPGTHRWEQLRCPNARWLTCESDATMEQSSQTVHINLLDGVLRVKGQPLNGLPHDVREIFCDQGFCVISSNLPGMDFATLPMVSKHQVHFSLRDDNLVVRAWDNQRNEILELIPSSKLRGDLPPALLDGHVHWLNLSMKTIDIRPLEQLWEQSSDHWRIECASGLYCMYKGHEALIDIRSPTWEMVSKCFECLTSVDKSLLSLDDEDLQRQSRSLLITTSPVDSVQSASMQRLSVTMPRYGLSFFVNEREELESCDFKDMVYDEDQCVGALFGLENLLVLRPKTVIARTLVLEALIPRRVLVPSGSFRSHGNHQDRIHIVPFAHDPFNQKLNEPSYYTYDVDTELGCLIGDGTLTSTRHLAYLHAMTSCYRPDPLTGKMGTEAALSLLRSATCRSTMELKSFQNSSVWISTQYPQINAAYEEILKGYYWNPNSHRLGKVNSVPEKRAARRAAYLFPSNAAGPTSLEDDDDNKYLTNNLPAEPGLATPPHSIASFNECLPRQIALGQLLCNRPVPELPARGALLRESHNTSSNDIPLLNQLLFSLRPHSSFQRKYLTHLEASAQCIRVVSQMTHKVASENRIEVLRKYYVQCRVNYLDSLKILQTSLGSTPTDPHEQGKVLNQFGHWPPITADVLLRHLASASLIDIPPHWKKCLISLALLLLDLQRSRRLLRFALDGLEDDFFKELENEGCDGWNPEEYPDWLLIQIQGNFLIRRTQAEAAMEIMSPRSGENTVMQVNMGEGKSSVIIPIAAAALADGKQLVRVIVPKALTVQMFELLVARLGGLTNRPIYHLPFSRTTEYNGLHKLMLKCMAERGILLVQPEHVVSLKLKSVEEQICEAKLMHDLLTRHEKSHIKTSSSLESIPRDSHLGNIFRSLRQLPNHLSRKDTIQADYHRDEHSRDTQGASDHASVQKWLHSHARDILDESDEILHARFQLVYTIGPQQHMDGYPDRWTITQQVLRLVKKHVYSLSGYVPDAIIEYGCGPSRSFPHVRIVRASDIGRRLILLITEDVMAGQLPNFNFQHISPALHSAIRSFISDEDVLQIPYIVKQVEEYAKDSCQIHLWSGLLLLRGLLASNILLFALSKRRWRVDYGVVSQLPRGWHPIGSTPTMLAVPYRAKDTPAPNTQFGHPDITIILTCLSYYYAGLSKEQLRVSFEILLDQDDPSAEYALWIKECESVPESLQELGEINLRSSEQWDEVIFPLFAWNQAAIDFYLSQVVFLKEAKEFPYKLFGSSCDLAEKREKLITGFSGTNDGQWLLPMSIAQRDLDHQKGTNAKVLAYLLQPENGSYMVTHESDERWTTHTLLQLVARQQPEICVLLDVGAQVLDLSNRQVATAWLDIAHHTAGALYFNENDELMVLTRNGKTSPMLSSPLSQQLDRCVVYLDHAHTRGTDIKLPMGSRAAVTLGPKVTKDALVQGCMRMRKLGLSHGHSVMFFAPPEVDRDIRGVAAKTDPNAQVTTADILHWAVHETWSDIQQRAPYWAQQGMSHKSRYDAWSRFCNNDITPKQLSDEWLQPDQKSLTDLYAPRETKSTLSVLDPDIQQRCKDLGVLSLPSAQMEEEQEREVNREQEREREVELPPKAEAVQHFLHPNVVSFVKTGIIPSLHSGSAFLPVFTTLEKSSAATREADVWSPLILATADFCKTIKPESTQGTMDQYLRPVQWILSSKRDRDQVLVLLSPFEADRLMPDIRASEWVHLHVYASRTSQRMKPSDDLKFYSIPPLPSDWTPPWALIDQLNVFAGQLYLRDYGSYLRLCTFLGVPTKEVPDGTAIRRNLFNIPGTFEETEITFLGSPLPSVMALLAIRSRGRPFKQTHMGKILQGQSLSEKDFEGPVSVVSDRYPTAYDRQTPHDNTTLPSPSDMECDARDDPASGSSVLVRSSKRRSEMAGISEAGLEPPRKRLRAGGQ